MGGVISYSRVKRVRATIKGVSFAFKSQSEFHFACYLQSLMDKGDIKFWRYEVKRFFFKTKKSHKVKNYLPDFYIYYPDGRHVWVEVKGRNDPRSRRQLLLFKEQFPNEKLFLLLTDSPRFKKRAAIGISWAGQNELFLY